MKNIYRLTEEDNKKIQASSIKKAPLIVEGMKKLAGAQDDSKNSLGLQVELAAEENPDRTAIFYEDIKYTHKEYNESVNRYANYFLNDVGLKKGDVVVVFVENRPELLFIIVACSKIGVVASLINTNLRKNPLIHCMTHTSRKCYIVGEELIDAFEDVKDKLNLSEDQKKHLYYLQDKDKIDKPEEYVDLNKHLMNSSIVNPPTTPEILGKYPYAYIFTSGTTGLPKAAIITNAFTVGVGILWSYLSMEMKPEDVMYITTPLFHSNSLNVAYISALTGRSAIAIRRKFSATHFWEDVRKYKATCFNYIGEICRYLYNQPPKDDDADNTIVKIIGNGLRNDIWKDFKKRFNIEKVCEFYAATERGFAAFLNMHNLDCTVGMTPTPSHALVQYDLENNVPFKDEETGFMIKVEEGTPGLLINKVDPNNFFMYTDQKETEKKLFRNAFEDGDMWVNTGDMLREIGYGHMQFVDRLGDTFRWKGENVSTEEVESVVNLFGQIEMCSVYGVLIPNTGGRAGMVTAVKSGEEEFNFSKFYELMKEYLPKYSIPLFLRFKEELEVTATHKIQKSKLKKEEYNINEITDPVYVLLPKSSEYVLLTKEIHENILNNEYDY